MGDMKRQKKLQKKWKKKAALTEQPPALVYKMNIVEMIMAHRMNKHMKAVHIQSGEKILAIGCFSGRLLHAYDQQTLFKGFYADQSPRLMISAMHMYPHFSYRLINERGIDYKDHKFHRTILSIPIHSFVDETLILSEIRRVTKKTGHIHLCSAVSHHLEELLTSTGLEVAHSMTANHIIYYDLVRTKTFSS